jgi:hypothetical protein
MKKSWDKEKCMANEILEGLFGDKIHNHAKRQLNAEVKIMERTVGL